MRVYAITPRFLIHRFGHELPSLEAYYALKADVFSAQLPPNPAIRELPDALAAAHAHYGVKEYVIRPFVTPVILPHVCRSVHTLT